MYKFFISIIIILATVLPVSAEDYVFSAVTSYSWIKLTYNGNRLTVKDVGFNKKDILDASNVRASYSVSDNTINFTTANGRVIASVTYNFKEGMSYQSSKIYYNIGYIEKGKMCYVDPTGTDSDFETAFNRLKVKVKSNYSANAGNASSGSKAQRSAAAANTSLPREFNSPGYSISAIKTARTSSLFGSDPIRHNYITAECKITAPTGPKGVFYKKIYAVDGGGKKLCVTSRDNLPEYCRIINVRQNGELGCYTTSYHSAENKNEVFSMPEDIFKYCAASPSVVYYVFELYGDDGNLKACRVSPAVDLSR